MRGGRRQLVTCKALYLVIFCYSVLSAPRTLSTPCYHSIRTFPQTVTPMGIRRSGPATRVACRSSHTSSFPGWLRCQGLGALSARDRVGTRPGMATGSHFLRKVLGRGCRSRSHQACPSFEAREFRCCCRSPQSCSIQRKVWGLRQKTDAFVAFVLVCSLASGVTGARVGREPLRRPSELG